MKEYIRKKVFSLFKKEILEYTTKFHSVDSRLPTVVSLSQKIDSSVFDKIGSDELDGAIKKQAMSSFESRLKMELFKKIEPYVSVYEFNQSSFPLPKGVKAYVAEILVIEPIRKRSIQ